MNDKSMWTVGYSTEAAKQKRKLPNRAQLAIDTLTKDMELNGPYRSNWPNYGPLKKAKNIQTAAFHCHVKKGKPTYVVCWRVENKEIKIIEVFYAGTHENALY